MDKKEYNEIINIFSFNNEIRKRYSKLNDYMLLISNWLKKNKLNTEQIIRYMLMGFYLSYRASVHMSTTFTTKKEDYKNDEIRLKCKFFNKINTKPLVSTKEYIDLLNIKDILYFRGLNMFKFVIDGKS